MSAADSAAHFHALLQLRGGAAARPPAAAAAAGGSCRAGTGWAQGLPQTNGVPHRDHQTRTSLRTETWFYAFMSSVSCSPRSYWIPTVLGSEGCCNKQRYSTQWLKGQECRSPRSRVGVSRFGFLRAGASLVSEFLPNWIRGHPNGLILT